MAHGEATGKGLETTDGSTVDVEVDARGTKGLVVHIKDDGEVKELLLRILSTLEAIQAKL